jgi:hypothetical protein
MSIYTKKFIKNNKKISVQIKNKKSEQTTFLPLIEQLLKTLHTMKFAPKMRQ